MSVLPVLCLLVGVALPIAAAILVIRRGVRPILVADAYREVGQRLGLVVDTRGTWIRGVLGGRRLWFGDVLEAGDRTRFTEVRGILTFQRPLGLGLYVRPRGAADRLYRRVRAREMPTADKAFDARFQVFADDPVSIPQVLDAAARDQLLDLLSLVQEVVVTDDAVFAFLRQAPAKGEVLARTLDAMTATGAAIEAARDAVAGRNPRWDALAGRLGLELSSRPALQGTFGGRRVDVVPARDGDGVSAWVHVGFPEPRENGFILRMQRSHDDPYTAGQDIEVGDAAFDAAFVVKGYDPQAVRARLLAAMDRILDLQKRGRIAADDHGLELRGVPMDEEGLEGAIRSACAAADALGY